MPLIPGELGPVLTYRTQEDTVASPCPHSCLLTLLVHCAESFARSWRSPSLLSLCSHTECLSRVQRQSLRQGFMCSLLDARVRMGGRGHGHLCMLCRTKTSVRGILEVSTGYKEEKHSPAGSTCPGQGGPCLCRHTLLGYTMGWTHFADGIHKPQGRGVTEWLWFPLGFVCIKLVTWKRVPCQQRDKDRCEQVGRGGFGDTVLPEESSGSAGKAGSWPPLSHPAPPSSHLWPCPFHQHHFFSLFKNMY